MLSAAEIRRLADHLAERLADQRVQRIFGSSPERLVLEFFGSQGRQWLLVCLEMPFPRTHLVTEKEASAKAPFSTLEWLRKELTDARLQTVAAVPNERILQFSFHAPSTQGAVERTLYLELFQKSRNGVLVDHRGWVLGTFRREGLRPGLKVQTPYAPPVLGAPRSDDRVPFAQFDIGEGDDISLGLAAWCAPREAEARHDDELTTARKALTKRLRKEERLLESVREELSSAEGAEALRQKAELLKAYLGTIPRGASEVRVPNWASPESGEIIIPLDPRENPKETMERWFRQAKKWDRGLAKLGARVAAGESRVQKLRLHLGQLDGAADEALVQKVIEVAREDGFLPRESPDLTKPKSKVEPPRRKPYRTFLSKDGIEILVGRTAADNDELSLRIGRGNEHWFHVANYPGSHVVVRFSDDDLPPETLLDAALLAAHFSQAPKGSRAEVHRTRCKHVGKFKGARPGQVSLASHKAIRVQPDPARLNRLVNSGGA